jgi:2-amino-4-hydroxy-6-hydroxymethyldihydropteridine diphosphokinase
MSEETVAYVALGANLGNPPEQIWQATRRLAVHDRVALRGSSSLWRSAPVGPVADQPDFINAVVRLVTVLEPRALLALCQAIETSLGRDRSREVPGGPRLIDLDLLTYGELVVEEEDLVVPHPGLAERAFVLEPLRELDPEFVHPATGHTIAEMIAALPPGQKAERIGPMGAGLGRRG